MTPNRFAAAWLALCLAFAAPAAALAQATAQTTMPPPPYQSNGRSQTSPVPTVVMVRDSVSNEWCIVGSTATCIMPGGAGGGGGTGTEYTEDAAGAANPVGGVVICVRRDTLSASEVTADGDNVALKCTAKGEAHVNDADANTALTAMQVQLDDLKTLVTTLNGKIDAVDASLNDIETQAESGTAATVQGDVAHGTADSGSPVKTGCKGLTADPTAEATGDRVNELCTVLGKKVVMPYALSGSLVSGLTASMTGTTSTAVTGMGAPGANLFNYITTIVCGNSDATVGTFIDLQDGNGGTVFFTIPAGAVYGGGVITLPAPLKQPTANTALYAVPKTTSSESVCSIAGFKAP